MKAKKNAVKAVKKVSPAKKSPARKSANSVKTATKTVAAPAPVIKKAKKAFVKISAEDKTSFKDKLLSLRERLNGQINSLKTDSLTRNDSVVSIEDGTDAFDRQMAISLAATENSSVFEIDDALRRIEEGTYGVCEECGGGIERVRLEALPFVRLCIGCQSETEKHKTGLKLNSL